MIPALPAEALVLETRRLRLTPYTADDVDIAKALLCDAQVIRYMGAADTEDTVEGHMSDAIRRGAGGCIGFWCVSQRDSGRKIGDCNLMPLPIDDDDFDYSQLVPLSYPAGQIELGYLFLPQDWGKGYATETCARLVRFAFEDTDLAELVSTTDPSNTRSQNVLRKCGFTYAGQKRAYGQDGVDWFVLSRAVWMAQTAKA